MYEYAGNARKDIVSVLKKPNEDENNEMNIETPIIDVRLQTCLQQVYSWWAQEQFEQNSHNKYNMTSVGSLVDASLGGEVLGPGGLHGGLVHGDNRAVRVAHQAVAVGTGIHTAEAAAHKAPEVKGHLT